VRDAPLLEIAAHVEDHMHRAAPQDGQDSNRS
jgi:hypothetical protein